MAFKFVVLCALVAVANAGLLGAPAAVAYSAGPAFYSAPAPALAVAAPALTTQHQNILRSPGNLQQISTYSKTIDTPFSSVSKSDVRVSNPGLIAAAPAISYAAAAPIVTKAAIAAPAFAAPAYAAPAYAAPAYAAPAYAARAYAAPAIAAPAAITAPGLLGVAYSAAPAVSHMTYSNGLGLTYGW